jgi:hypothetical protein
MCNSPFQWWGIYRSNEELIGYVVTQNLLPSVQHNDPDHDIVRIAEFGVK